MFRVGENFCGGSAQNCRWRLGRWGVTGGASLVRAPAAHSLLVGACLLVCNSLDCRTGTRCAGAIGAGRSVSRDDLSPAAGCWGCACVRGGATRSPSMPSFPPPRDRRAGTTKNATKLQTQLICICNKLTNAIYLHLRRFYYCNKPTNATNLRLHLFCVKNRGSSPTTTEARTRIGRHFLSNKIATPAATWWQWVAMGGNEWQFLAGSDWQPLAEGGNRP